MTAQSSPGSRIAGQALVAREGGRFDLEQVLTAPFGPSTIAIRTTCSGVSIGTEFAVLSGKLDWGDFPLVTGYMGVGRVTDVGADVTGFDVGDRVYYRRNAELLLEQSGQPLNCAAGVHASVAVLDPTGDHGADIVPDGVPDDLASMFVVPAVGLKGTDMAGVHVGASVVVLGVGMVGLAVVAACAARGARVTAVDLRAEPLEVARRLGAHTVLDATQVDVDAEVRRLTDGAGADFVFESTGHGSSVDLGIRLCRQLGCFVWQGNYGDGPVSFEFLAAHSRRLRMVFPCDDGYRPFRRAVLDSMAQGRLRWDETITDRLHASEAPKFFERVLADGAGRTLGATIRWSDEPA